MELAFIERYLVFFPFVTKHQMEEEETPVPAK